MTVDIRNILDGVSEGGTAILPSGEYEGPFRIRKSCTVIGRNTVLWCVSGPVVIAEAENIKMENLRISLTGSDLPPEKNVSVFCKFPDTKFTDVEVSGAVIGIPQEEQYWEIPEKLSLGKIPAERETAFSFEVYAPADAGISCGLYDVRLLQQHIYAGKNEVSFTVGMLKSGMILYGEILIKSAVTRKIVLTGEAVTDGVMPQRIPLFKVDGILADKWKTVVENYDPFAASEVPEQETVEIYETSDGPVRLEDIDESEFSESIREENVYLVTGETVPLAPKKYCIELDYTSSKANLDIDGYLFMLGKSGKVEKDKDMIFFGNDRSSCGSVRYVNSPERRAMIVDLGLVPENIRRMAMLFSIYGDSPMQTFDKLVDGEVDILCENGVHLHLRLEPNINHRTILALGLEKNDGVWELIPSGKGVAMPLEDICRSYGVTII